jgi:hypothetical protein
MALTPDVEVAVTVRPRLHRAGVRTRLGLGQAERGDDLARGHARQVLGLLLLGAEHDEALAADADIGAEGRAESGADPAHLQDRKTLLLGGQVEAAVLLGDGQAEQAQRLHLRQHVVGDLVLFGDLRLERPQAFGGEATDGFEQLGERVGVEGH